MSEEAAVHPEQLDVYQCIAIAEEAAKRDGPVVYTNRTPSGIVVEYSPSPKRFYRVNGVEVPSVTTVLDVLVKPSLPWWGMTVGVGGVQELIRRDYQHPTHEIRDVPLDELVDALTKHKLTVNHVRDRAADRGTAIHDGLEDWVEHATTPDPFFYPANERGYVEGLARFFADVSIAVIDKPQAEVMVGSVEHGYAGRFDLRLNLAVDVELVTRCYPKKADKREMVPAGSYLVDLKSSKNVYPSHALQLAAYELASVECGYTPTDYRAVLHVTQDGKYEFVRTYAEPSDFLTVLHTYNVMQQSKSWFQATAA